MPELLRKGTWTQNPLGNCYVSVAQTAVRGCLEESSQRAWRCLVTTSWVRRARCSQSCRLCSTTYSFLTYHHPTMGFEHLWREGELLRWCLDCGGGRRGAEADWTAVRRWLV
jgi:hypothetical protein